MPGGQFLELLLLKWSDFDNSKIAAGHFTHNYGLDLKNPGMTRFTTVPPLTFQDDFSYRLHNFASRYLISIKIMKEGRMALSNSSLIIG